MSLSSSRRFRSLSPSPCAPPRIASGDGFEAVRDTLQKGKGTRLIGDYRGLFNGQPFSGHEVQGFDALKGKYVATWVDSMMDHIMSFEGTYDEKTQTLAMFTDSFDMQGKPIKERHDTKFVDADNWVFTMNQLAADGAYKPTMTITYTRKH